VGLRAELGPGAAPFAGDDRLALDDACIEVAEIDRRSVAHQPSQSIDGAGVVGVRMREGDADDRRAGVAGGGNECLRAATKPGVDQREAVVLSDEIGVDEPVLPSAGSRRE
jgi:hypothetical protein